MKRKATLGKIVPAGAAIAGAVLFASIVPGPRPAIARQPGDQLIELFEDYARGLSSIGDASEADQHAYYSAWFNELMPLIEQRDASRVPDSAASV